LGGGGDGGENSLSSGQLLLSSLLLCNNVDGVSTLELAPQHSTFVATNYLQASWSKAECNKEFMEMMQLVHACRTT
jgi:hypothetical protein